MNDEIEEKLHNMRITFYFPNGGTTHFENVVDIKSTDDCVSFYTDKTKSRVMSFSRVPFSIDAEITYVRKRNA
jgi:hypothetical protein